MFGGSRGWMRRLRWGSGGVCGVGGKGPENGPPGAVFPPNARGRRRGPGAVSFVLGKSEGESGGQERVENSPVDCFQSRTPEQACKGRGWEARRDAGGGYKVGVGRGERVGRASSEWFARPDDERYLSLSDLMASMKGRADRGRPRTAESASVRVEASRDDPERLNAMARGKTHQDARLDLEGRAKKLARQPFDFIVAPANPNEPLLDACRLSRSGRDENCTD